MRPCPVNLRAFVVDLSCCSKIVYFRAPYGVNMSSYGVRTGSYLNKNVYV